MKTGVDGVSQCVCDHSPVASRAVSVITRRHCDHSQCLFSRSGFTIHPPAPPRLSPDALLRRLDSLALSCVSLTLGHARALRTRVRSRSVVSGLSLSLSLSLSLVSGQRPLVCGLSRLQSLSSRALSLVSWHASLSTCHSSRLSPLLFCLLSVAGQPAINCFKRESDFAMRFSAYKPLPLCRCESECSYTPEARN